MPVTQWGQQPVMVYELQHGNFTMQLHDTWWEGAGIMIIENHDANGEASKIGAYPLTWQPVTC